MSLAPNAISGLQLWLDADAISGLSDGDTVATWADQSGNGNDYTGNNAGITYQTGVLNGLPVVEMHVGGFTGGLSLVSPFSIFYVGRFIVGGSGHVSVQSSSNSWFMGPNSEWRWNSNVAGINSGVASNSDWVVHGVMQEEAAEREIAPFAYGFQYVYDLDTNAVPTVTALTIASDINVLRLGNAGIWNSAGNAMGGDMAELVAYDRMLDPVERVGLTDYFREKWGGIVAASTEDTDTQGRIARIGVMVGHNFPAADTEMRLARLGVEVAHHYPEALTEVRLARLGVVVAISRPHGWNVFDDPPL